MSTRATVLLLSKLFALSAAGIFSLNTAGAQNASGSAPAGGIASPIGKIITASGVATVEHSAVVVLQANVSSGTVNAKAGDFVYKGDVVQTGANGKIDITFTDGTAFNVSSNAKMELNEFVYDPKGNSNSALFNLTKGGFTFVAGNVAKTGNMKFDTPVATMGIRGTTPRVVIANDGTVTFSTLVEGDRDAAMRAGNRTPAPTRPGAR